MYRLTLPCADSRYVQSNRHQLSVAKIFESKEALNFIETGAGSTDPRYFRRGLSKDGCAYVVKETHRLLEEAQALDPTPISIEEASAHLSDEGLISPDTVNWGCPADLLTNQTVLDPKVHCHTSRAPQVGIEPTSPPTKVVAVPTQPQIPAGLISPETNSSPVAIDGGICIL